MTTNRSLRIRTAALIGGGVVAGVIGASALGASAQTTTAAAPSGASTSAGTSASGSSTSNGREHGSETTVTGATAATLKANALQHAPGATIDRITTEDSSASSKAAYEVHLTKADGSEATLLFAADLSYLSTQTGGGHGGHDGHGGGAGETAVTGANAATLRAAALTKVPGATVDEVTTDSGDAAYEVHLTKADGSEATVKFDKSLTFVSIEDGRGR